MIRDIEVLNEIITIRKKTELLANPLYNDFHMSTTILCLKGYNVSHAVFLNFTVLTA